MLTRRTHSQRLLGEEFLNPENWQGSFTGAGAPSFSYSEAQSINGKVGSDTAPPAFVPRNLLLEAKREIRVLQERCRELECGFNDMKQENEALRKENKRVLQQVGQFEVRLIG